MKKQGHTMLTLFQSYLSSIGVNVKEGNDTTISFENNELQYLFMVDNADPYYFRLLLPNVVSVSEENKSKITQLVTASNAKFKVAKAIILNDNVWISAEQFVYSKDNINDLFNRVLHLLETFIGDFRKELKS